MCRNSDILFKRYPINRKQLTALHSSLEVNDGILHTIKTEKIEEDDTNSYVTVNVYLFKTESLNVI